MQLSKTIGTQDKIPNGYGVAYFCYDSNQAVCYPIPINLIIGLWHKIKARCKRGYHERLDMLEQQVKRLEDNKADWVAIMEKDKEHWLRDIEEWKAQFKTAFAEGQRLYVENKEFKKQAKKANVSRNNNG